MIVPSTFRLPSPRGVPAEETPAAGHTSEPHPVPPEPSSLWLVNVVEEADTATALAAEVLDEEEQKRAAAFVRDEHRRAYVASHVALRTLLGTRLGIAPGAVELTRETCPTCGGPHGRPAVAGGAPHFSLSHSGDLALVAMAPTTVGVDVEKAPALKVADQTGHMLHPDEVAELTALPDEARAAAFGRAWVRKEAYLKALGTGLSRSLALDYLGTGPTPAPGPPGWTLTDIRMPDGYLAAMALANA